MGKPYTTEELNTRLDRVNGWINNCDQKANILLAFAGALAAVLISSDIIKCGYDYLAKPFYEYWINEVDAVLSVKKIIVFSLLVPILYFAFKMVWFLVLVLRPKTIITDLLEEKSVITKNSLLHFQSIAGMKYNDFQKRCIAQSEDSYLNDLCSQIYCNSKICNDKFENYKLGFHYFLKLMLCSVIELIVVFILPQI